MLRSKTNAYAMGEHRCLSAIVTALLIPAAGLTPKLCLAGPGDLDPTFGEGGVVLTDFLSDLDLSLIHI